MLKYGRYLVIIGGIILSFGGHASSEEGLTFGFLPYLAPSELFNKYTPLVDYLSAEVGHSIVIKVAKTYEEHIERIGKDQLDIAFLGGAPYVKMVGRYGQKPLLARYEIRNEPSFHGVIFVADKSPLQNLSDLAGKRFAFGAMDSTLTTLVPIYMLKQVGIELSELAGYEFLKNQQNVVFGVLLGDYAAGSSALEVFEEYRQKGIRSVAVSPPVSTHLLVTRQTLPLALIEKLRAALYSLKGKAAKDTILPAISHDLTGFVKVQDTDYDSLRTILKEVGVVKPKTSE